MTTIKVFGPLQAGVMDQIERCATEGSRAVLCADHHIGYSQPIGGAVAYPNHISPSGVGYDIGCGNKAVRTNLLAADVDIGGVMDEIVERIGFGMGRPNPEPVDHPVLEKIFRAEFRPQRKLSQIAGSQLGTVGAGNHYVDLFSDEEGWLWIGVHFGSRGFGHKTASGFLALAKGLDFDSPAPQGEMHAPPTLLDTRSQLGQDYVEAMKLAGEYAYAGRDMVCVKVLELLGARATDEVHNHHNFAWRENHGGADYWVVRKGCTPLFPGQRGFVGSSMGSDSFILEGIDSPTSREALYSTVHGAGRVMSRTQAAGKRKWIKGKPQIVAPGAVDWPKVLREIKAKGIELRGGAADEAPEVYKSLEEVLGYHASTFVIRHRLKPLGVAMAGADTVDPYKD
ncbi:MAG: RNA-splicing ligase RtcB [Fimbriimonadaceae bacterium]|nr:RNA-splicing ligase RtcB [Fimbriimonadaceae bacterium]